MLDESFAKILFRCVSNMYACDNCLKKYKNTKSLATHRYTFHNSKRRLSDEVKNVIDIQRRQEGENIPINSTKKIRKIDDAPKAQPDKNQDEVIENSIKLSDNSRIGEGRQQKRRSSYKTNKNDFRDDDYNFDDYFKLIRMLCKCILNRLIPLEKNHIILLKKHESFIRDVAYLQIKDAKKTMLSKQYALDVVLRIIVPLLPQIFSYILLDLLCL